MVHPMGFCAALTYLRMFPEHVRTVTLDAVVDLDFVMFMDAAEDEQSASGNSSHVVKRMKPVK